MNLATKRFLTLLLLWLVFAHLTAVELTGVRAVDEGRGASKVTLTLSESSPYRLKVSEDKKSFRVVFSGVKNQATIPDYTRLSPVIDRIVSSTENGDAVVEIRTMKGCNYTEYTVDRRVCLELEFIKKPAPKAKVARRRVSRPKAAAVVQKPDIVCTPEETVAPDSAVVKAPQDTVMHPQPQKKELTRVRPGIKWPHLVRSPEFWIIIAAAVLALVILFFVLFRKKKPKLYDFEVVTRAKSSVPEPVEEVNPVLSRMAKTLAEQGWTAAEIAAELNISEAAARQIMERGEE
jgi:hypothetical protein